MFFASNSAVKTFWKSDGDFFLQIAHYRRYQRRVQDFKCKALFA
jgi:hypothetical protein